MFEDFVAAEDRAIMSPDHLEGCTRAKLEGDRLWFVCPPMKKMTCIARVWPCSRSSVHLANLQMALREWSHLEHYFIYESVAGELPKFENVRWDDDA